MDMESQNRPEPDPIRLDIPPERRLPEPRFPITLKTVAIFLGLFSATVFTTWWVGGPWYSFGLISILATHEFGHYWACRRNNVNASLPNFIPLPEIKYFLNIGTVGAFIVIKERIPNRRALMEIGASGPIAGFVMAVPILAAGLLSSDVMPTQSANSLASIQLGDSLIFLLLAKVTLGINPFSVEETVMLHPLAWAGWLGMFFTALNLLPLGQLDGGHVVHSLFKPRTAFWLVRVFFVALLVMGYWWPGWWLWAGIVFVLGLKHPPTLDESVPLEPKHRLMGYASLVIFTITFIPIPIW